MNDDTRLDLSDYPRHAPYPPSDKYMDRMQKNIELVECWWFVLKWGAVIALVMALVGCGV